MVLRVLAVSDIQSRLVGESKETLGRVAIRNRLSLIWVPAHTDIRGNEISDKLSSLEMTGPKRFVWIARC